MAPQQFGGPWTEKKLEALERYLKAYLTIFTKNRKAATFIRHYVDAFAGSGLRQVRDAGRTPLDLGDAGEALDYMDGSVRKVLSLGQQFHRYWFVEKEPAHAASLREMVDSEYPERASCCHIENGDANEFLLRWSEGLKAMDRAVVFLDPYGMNVRWHTIEKLATTKKIDLWMLFPSSGVIRMLPRQGPPDEAWSRRLTELFGDESWKEEFYRQETITDLFGEHQATQRVVSEETVAVYLLRRLESLFAGVVDRPLVLRNSRRSPLFMLVFAAGNPSGAITAIKIAGDIIRNT
jgi:three-Cys-motif partner protein